MDAEGEQVESGTGWMTKRAVNAMLTHAESPVWSSQKEAPCSALGLQTTQTKGENGRGGMSGLHRRQIRGLLGTGKEEWPEGPSRGDTAPRPPQAIDNDSPAWLHVHPGKDPGLQLLLHC